MFFDSLLPTPPLQFTLVLYLQDRNKSKWQIFVAGFENDSVPYTILTPNNTAPKSGKTPLNTIFAF